MDQLSRAQAEADLRLAQEHFASAFEEAPIGMALVAPDGRFLKVNRSLCEIGGYSEAELLKRRFQEITHPDDLDTDLEFVRRMLAGEIRTYQLEKRYFHRRGQIIWVRLSVSLVRDDRGEPLHFISQIEDITASKELHEAQARLQAIFDHAPVGMSLRARDGSYLHVNEFAARSLGTTPEQLVGHHPGEHHGPAAWEQIRAVDAEMLRTRTERTDEFTVPNPDGLEHDYYVVRYPVLDDAGEVSAFGVFSLDITDRKRVERALQESERRLSDAQALARFGSWEWDVSTDRLIWSDELCRIFGFEPGSPPDGFDAFFELVHPDDRAILKRGIENARADVETESEFRIVRSDGALRWVLARRRKVSSGLRLAGTLQDITERKQTEQTVRELAAIVASSDDAIIGGALDGTITSWNPAAERFYGYSASEAMGRDISLLLVRLEQRAEMEQMLERVARGEQIAPFDTTRRHKDGHSLDVSITVSPIHDSRGKVVGASTITRNIGERKRAAAALEEAEQRFRGAFEGSPIGMALMNPDAMFTKVNDALCVISGYGRAQLEGTGLASLLHPDDATEVREGIVAVERGEQSLYAAEKRVVHASGRPVWAALQVTLIHAADGTPLRLLAQVQDVTDRKHYEDRLAQLADHDPLTGLLNRRSFSRLLEQQAALVARYGPEGALLMLDLDHFKYVNDTLGHQAGDNVIIAVAELLGARLRASDLLARLGGDEFAVLLPKADATAAERVAEQLLQALRDQPVTITGLSARAITASIGIATFDTELTGEDVLVNSDLAMYDAKEAGRDGIATFKNAEHEGARMKGRLSWVERIRAALEQDRFSLVSQPIVELSSGRVIQHELLLRMVDEHGELIPPGAFLYIAERLDMIQEIDAWVVRHATELLATDLDGNMPLEINISGRSIGDARLLELIEHQLEQTGVAPNRLIFEITETAAIEQISKARAFSQRLAQLGCRLALDDFGAGFGSFYYLKHLTFDYLKIDGEFIQHCTTSKTDQLVVRAIVDIARGLDKITIAEFVTDEETARLLRRLGVNYGQGYHYGQPELCYIGSNLGSTSSTRAPLPPSASTART